jgi:8-oxo-dGTP diphosphatase
MRTARPEAAVVFFVNRNGELLLRLRDDGPHLPHPGCWDTIGGAQEPGEAPGEALEREVKEEIGLELTDGTFWRDQQGDVLLHIYAAPLEKTAGALHLIEGQRVAWFGPEDGQRCSSSPGLRRC